MSNLIQGLIKQGESMWNQPKNWLWLAVAAAVVVVIVYVAYIKAHHEAPAPSAGTVVMAIGW